MVYHKVCYIKINTNYGPTTLSANTSQKFTLSPMLLTDGQQRGFP